ncbi:MDR family oxidoreductase [Tepidamorphus sp. 3E244]|uniref:acrylyl-CoA reductase (NADPH) n=1 Tax=Tepidamorphus sp. 3E244 TaxID=3385498 RepID=UPI0038FC492D
MGEFPAILISKEGEKGQKAELTTLSDSDLMDGDVTVRVTHSTLNYKDGLALTGKAPIVRTWPLIPGIDFAGEVEASDNPEFKPGDRVILNGWGVGETHHGGFAGKARVKGDWLIPCPDSLTNAQAMAIGTAGYTAALCVLAISDNGAAPAKGPAIVTGAAGGVGSTAVSLLAKLGFEVLASTGRASEADYLKSLGASDIVDRNELSEPGRPLGKERWAGGVDSVGSHTLANVLAQTKYGGCVAACGLAQGMDLPATVAPFILRGVSLLGIDSVMAPREKRARAYELLTSQLDKDALDKMSTTIGLGDLMQAGEDIIAGKTRGRVVVEIS